MYATLDLYDKSILLYSISDKPNIKLVLNVLRNSFTLKRNSDLILYSNRGSYLLFLEYREALNKTHRVCQG